MHDAVDAKRFDVLRMGAIGIDAIVVGAGIMGCSLAHGLSQIGLKVLVLERSIPGAEASSTAAGILSPGVEAVHLKSLLALAQQSLNLHEAQAKSLEKLTGISVGFHRSGVLQVAVTDAELDDLKKQQQKNDHANQGGNDGIHDGGRWCDSQACLKLEPGLSKDVLAGRHFAADAQVDPKELLKALHQAAKEQGALFVSDKQVNGVEQDKSGVWGVRVDGALIKARHVFVAAGSWTSLVPGLCLQQDAVFPVRGQVVRAHMSERELKGLVFGAGGYMVPRCSEPGSGADVLFGATQEHVGFLRANTVQGVHSLLNMAMRIIPKLNRAQVLAFDTNFRPATQDGLPLIGPIGSDGLWVVSGHYRNGILLAPITAKLVVDSIAHGKTSPALQSMSPERFLV